MTNHYYLVCATECRKNAAECRKAGFLTIAQVNIEMAQEYEAKAHTELILDNTDD